MAERDGSPSILMRGKHGKHVLKKILLHWEQTAATCDEARWWYHHPLGKYEGMNQETTTPFEYSQAVSRE